MRLTLEQTWQMLEARGESMPRQADGSPFVPPATPRADDDELGFSFFRTSVGGTWASLSLPRTFFGRSRVERADFSDTDLTESVLCWNDFLDVSFAHAVLRGADLRASVFARCLFAGADLRNADLRGSSFGDCRYMGAQLDGATAERGAPWLVDLSAPQRASLRLTFGTGEAPLGG